MKNFSLKYLILLLFSFVLITGCDDDEDEPEVSPFVDNYVITKAVLTEDLVIPVVPIPGVVESPIVLPVGFDITAAIQTALLNNVTCDSPDKSWIELREDQSMYMSCEGANELNAGTWTEVSATELSLNMNATAVPPLGFVLDVTDIVEANGTLSGLTSVPLPQTMVAAMIAPAVLAPDAPPIFMANFSLDILRK